MLFILCFLFMVLDVRDNVKHESDKNLIHFKSVCIIYSCERVTNGYELIGYLLLTVSHASAVLQSPDIGKDIMLLYII